MEVEEEPILSHYERVKNFCKEFDNMARCPQVETLNFGADKQNPEIEQPNTTRKIELGEERVLDSEPPSSIREMEREDKHMPRAASNTSSRKVSKEVLEWSFEPRNNTPKARCQFSLENLLKEKEEHSESPIPARKIRGPLLKDELRILDEEHQRNRNHVEQNMQLFFERMDSSPPVEKVRLSAEFDKLEISASGDQKFESQKSDVPNVENPENVNPIKSEKSRKRKISVPTKKSEVQNVKPYELNFKKSDESDLLKLADLNNNKAENSTFVWDQVWQFLYEETEKMSEFVAFVKDKFVPNSEVLKTLFSKLKIRNEMIKSDFNWTKLENFNVDYEKLALEIEAEKSDDTSETVIETKPLEVVIPNLTRHQLLTSKGEQNG